MDPGSSTEISRDSVAALGTIRTWKTFFVSIAALCVGVHAATWVAVRHFGVLDARTSPSASPVTDTSVVGPLPTPTADRERADIVFRAIQTALPLTEFVGRIAVLLLAVTMLTAVLTGLTGRLPVHGFIRGFFESIAAFAFCLPWERLTVHGARLTGVFFDSSIFDEAIEVAPVSGSGQALLFVRYVAYPLFLIILLVLASLHFRRSYRESLQRPGANIPMRVV
ncbi:MAG: hypothetical protein L6Q92_02245 [Phycisphaerae bacterium]|nr:hypothetical protein [Phycisphaerae bacterium]